MILGKWSDGPRLGAVELVELGSIRRHASMGGFLDFLGGFAGEVAGFFGSAVGAGLGFLKDALNVGLKPLMDGVASAFTGLADILREIPLIGEIVGGLILVINAAIQTLLSLPGLLIDALPKILKGLTSSFFGAYGKDEQSSILSTVLPKVAARAPEPIRNVVKTTLAETRPAIDGSVQPPESAGGIDPLVIAGVSAAVVAAALIAA